MLILNKNLNFESNFTLLLKPINLKLFPVHSFIHSLILIIILKLNAIDINYCIANICRNLNKHMYTLN